MKGVTSPSAQLYLRTLFDFVLSPLPPGGPGEDPDCHFRKEIVDSGPDPGVMIIFI